MASQPDLTNIAISSGYATLIHTEESGGVSSSYTNIYDGDGTLVPMAFATTGVKIIDGSYDFDVASHDGTNGLRLGGTLVTSSATELNYLDVSSIGSAQASKALILDSSSDISGIRNLTATGTIQASAFTATGNTTIGDSVANDTVAFNSTITTNLVFEGSTANAYETTLSITDPTADRTWTIPDATDTSVGRATTDTLTNKTLTAPDINTPDIDGGTVDAITSLTVANNVDIGSYDLRAGTLTADGLTSGRVVFAGTNGVLSDDSDLSFSGATLSATNMTSSGTVTFGSLSDGSITITAFVDEDGMDSNSATLIPTQSSVKAYVDAQVTAQDLDFQGDSGGALNIDLDSETLDIAGGTGIDTSGSSNTLTVAIDSTVATLAGSQTLSNKTLASPTITTQFTIGSATISEAELEILDGANVTTTELNIIDGDTSATSTTVADADRVVFNDAGVMKQVAVTDLSAYFDDEITAMPNLVQTSALNSGSITSGFGNIDNGSSTANFGATTVDSLSVSDGNITNVGSIALDSISADSTTITFSSAIDFGTQNMTNVDIDSGTIDGATIATSNVTVGSGKTLDVSAGTLTLANNQISGDKVEGGTIAGTTITALTTAGITASANIDIGSYDLRASTLTADSQTSGNVAIYGTNGLLSEDSDLTFSGSTLTATNVTISGTLTTTGTVQEVSTTNLNVQDPLILLNKYDSQPSNNLYDAGIVIKRGSSDSAPANVAMIWDESAETFSLVDTSEDGTTAGNVSITDYENLRVGALTADDASTFTSTISTASGSTIGNLTLADGSITSSGSAISFGSENLSTSGTLGAGAITGTSFIIGSADIGEAELEILDGATVTTDELNLIDGDTSRGTTAVASGDGILINDGGTMRMTNVDTVSTYFSSHNVGGGNIVTTGSLSSGSIASGFGTISTGNAITTTGVGTFASLDISGDVDVDGTLETDALTIGGTTLAETISDTVGAMVGSNTETGIAVTYEDGDNTLDFVLGATQTTLTSILNASLVAGRDADNQVKFSTDDQIIFRVAGGDGVTMKASGEIEATSLDISGAIDVLGTTNLDVVDIDGAVDMASTLAVGSTINGVGINVFETNSILISHDGSTGTIDSAIQNTGLGHEVFDDLTQGDYNTGVGYHALTKLTSGSNNSALGRASLEANTTGSSNTAIGFASLEANTTASNNTAVGKSALALNTSGTRNTAIGATSLDTNSTGNYNTAVGQGSLHANTTASQNTALGDSTLYTNTTGSLNTAVGQGALYYNTTGANNVAIGVASLEANTTVDNCVCIGFQAGKGINHANADGTVAIGYQAGLVADSTSGSVFIGYKAGTDVVSGGNNTAVGYLAFSGALGTTADDSTDNTFIGYGAGSGGWADAVSNHNVAVGSASMDSALNGASQNTCVGFHSGGGIIEGDTNTFIGFRAGEANTSGYQNVYIGASTAGSIVTAVNQIAIGNGATGVANNTAIIGNSSVTDVYMGDNGNAWSQTSDGRLKENVKEWNKGLDEINKLRVVEFNFKKDNPFDYNSDKKRQGIIAQEAQEVLPEMIKDDSEWLSANTEPMVWALVKAVQELSAKVEALENA